MKEIIKDSFKNLVADRYLLLLLSVLILMALSFSVIIALSIHPSELQLVSHYSAFGVTHLYRDQWFYLLVFVAFELVAAALHALISVKLLITKGRSIAIMFAWYGIGIVILGLVTALAVINYWIP
jgi:hypothetical protein